MKTSTEICVDVYDLTEAIKASLGLEDLELRDLFWKEDFMNDCYKSLWFDDDDEVYECDDEEHKTKVKLRNAIYRYLRLQFPNRQRILVDVSW